jgi:UDP-N-acetylglucosamine 2-epimerase
VSEQLNLLIGRGCRSDYPLSDGIIKKIRDEKGDWCNLQLIYLIEGDFIESYKKAQSLFELFDYDLVLCCGDRIETVALGICAFFNNIKVMHLGAGITNYPLSTFDDITRHWLTLASEVQLCEDKTALLRSSELLNIIKKKSNGYIVGNFYSDGFDDIDESLVPKDIYDLVLINPTTIIKEELKMMSFEDDLTIFIQPNSDLKQFLKDFEKTKPLKNEIFYTNLPRPQFLGLMKNCKRFYTNSSCAYYEAPYFLKPEQIILIGTRNKNRSTPKVLETGASQKIVNILKKYFGVD